jgi:prokaryotic ubiquitin-like protein Pup
LRPSRREVPVAKSGGGEQKKKVHKHGGEGDEAGADAGQVQKKGEEIKEDIDELLDEIDSVLEENAEEFIRSYVQKGGQ